MNPISANGSQSDESVRVRQKFYEKSDFETAMSATGFGPYNYILITLGCLWNIISLVDVTSFSFILPMLQCHLKLSLNEMGLLNSIMFFGMICGSLMWGVLSDMLGRQKLLAFCIFLLGLINLALGFSNSYHALLTFKFFGGFVVSGPFTLIISYISEMHSVAYRARILVGIATFYGGGNFITSLLGLIFLTRDLDVSFLGTTLHSWQLLLLTIALLDILGGILACLLPESPKFLMSRGRREEALQILQTMFEWNTGKHRDTYPIKILDDEAPDRPEQIQHQNVNGCSGVHEKVNFNKCEFLSRNTKRAFSQIAPMFQSPHITKCMLVYSIELFLLLGLNTMRLWMPQVFALMADGKNDYEFDICNKIHPKDIINANTTESFECSSSFIQPKSIFLNSMIVQSVGIMGALFICIFINVIHNKLMLVCITLIASIASVTIYFSISPLMVVVMYSLTVGLGFTAQAAFSSILPSVVPTAFRSTVISISLTCGRIGSMLGTYIFPHLMAQGCWPPFIAVGVDLFVCATLCIFLPRSTRKMLL